MTTSAHTILPLPGCTPTPIAAYLKALGIVRILATQLPESAPKAHWRGNSFYLSSTLDRDELIHFFLHNYAPSPIVAPWNGGSGFYVSDNSSALEAIEKSTAPRFKEYRETITAARTVVTHLKLTAKPEKTDKDRMLLHCRNTFSEPVLDWLDSAFVLTDDGAKYPPLLGTGGNDGRLEFTNNFMQRLTELLPLQENDSPAEQTTRLLDHAFFATPIRGLVNKAIGQYNPVSAGGANISTGFEGGSMINPWDFILALEGTLLFASAALKKLEGAEHGQLVYPFCVQSSGSGYGSSALADEENSRCEIWMPLWTNAATFEEIHTLFLEGRAWVGRRPAKNGVDFARAIASLGVDRRVAEFQRFGFHVRNGLAYFATPLQRIRVQRNHVAADLLAPIDGWVQSFLSRAKSASAPGSIQRAARALEAAILALCSAPQENNPEVAQELLLSLGNCERSLATAKKWTTESYIRPIPPLPSEWIRAADTGSSEFRLAASLASLRLRTRQEVFPIRRHLEPVRIGSGTSRWAQWDFEKSTDVVSSDVSATALLLDIMRRRLLLAQAASPDSWPEFAYISAWPADIADFIEGRIDEELFIRLLWGLSLIGFSQETKIAPFKRPESDKLPPAFFSQLKLCFTHLPDERTVPVTPAIFNLAANGDGTRASAQALRRLHGSNIPVTHVPISLHGEAVHRSAAALLFPLWNNQLRSLSKFVAPELFLNPLNV